MLGFHAGTVSALVLTMTAMIAPAVSPAAAQPAATAGPGSRPGDTDWPYYNRDPTGMRFSPLDEINARNVAQLKEVCRVHVSGPGPFSSSITLVNGILYVTSTLSTVALDATQCDVLWKSNYSLEEPQVFNTHRGVGYSLVAA